MKSPYHFMLYVGVFLFSVIFNACERDEPDNDNKATISEKISGTIIGAESLAIDSVYAISEEDEVLGKSKVVDNKFSLTLSTPSVSNLEKMAQDIPEGITISNTDVMFGGLENFTGITKQKEKTALYCFKTSGSITDSFIVKVISFIYVDRAVKISGNFTENMKEDEIDVAMKITYDLNLIKGWNIVQATQKIDTKIMSAQLMIENINSLSSDFRWTTSNELGLYGNPSISRLMPIFK